MSTKQKELTAEQKERLRKKRDEWMQFCLDGDATIKDAKGEVSWLYEFAGLPAPDVIEVGSPMAAQIAAALLADPEILAIMQSADGNRCAKAIEKVLAKKRKVKVNIR